MAAGPGNPQQFFCCAEVLLCRGGHNNSFLSLLQAYYATAPGGASGPGNPQQLPAGPGSCRRLPVPAVFVLRQLVPGGRANIPSADPSARGVRGAARPLRPDLPMVGSPSGLFSKCRVPTFRVPTFRMFFPSQVLGDGSQSDITSPVVVAVEGPVAVVPLGPRVGQARLVSCPVETSATVREQCWSVRPGARRPDPPSPPPHPAPPPLPSSTARPRPGGRGRGTPRGAGNFPSANIPSAYKLAGGRRAAAH